MIPAVDFAKLDLVLVITNYKPGEGLPEILLPNGFGVDTSAADDAASEGVDAAPTATPAEQN